MPITTHHERALVLACMLCSGSGASAQNLLSNPGFESGQSPWTGFGSSLQVFSADAFGGNNSARATNRAGSWAGFHNVISGSHPSGTFFLFEGAMRLDSVADTGVRVQLRAEPAGGSPVSYSVGTRREMIPGEWLTFSGLREIEYTGNQPTLKLQVQTISNTGNFSVDDWSVTVYEEDPNWLVTANAGIEQHRKRDLEMTVVDVHGNTLSDSTLDLQQTKHRFAFGGTMEWQLFIPTQNTAYTDRFLSMFEWCTPRNALKWEASEGQQRDNLDWSKPDALIDFCVANDIDVYGHNIFWANPQFVPEWAKTLDNPRLQGEMRERIEDVTSRISVQGNDYGEVIELWDVNNEMVHETYFLDRFGPGIRDWMFTETEANQPNDQLYLNDFNVVGGGIIGGDAETYRDHALDFLDRGIPIHGIGAQCHFGTRPIVARWVRDRIDILAEAGLPVRITELDIARDDENERADDLEKFFRVAFSHPAVNGITLWGWWEDNHALGAAASLVHSDFSLNAAGERYMDLIDEWTTSALLLTDGSGLATIRGFHGTYTASVMSGGYSTEPDVFELEPGEGAREVVIVALGACVGDIDANEISDGFDIAGGLQQLAAGDRRLDLDGSGTFSIDDVDVLIQEVEAGCP
ncbi:MAG: endo-1,4-beta-xylanase [Planctomycetota bacterium]